MGSSFSWDRFGCGFSLGYVSKFVGINGSKVWRFGMVSLSLAQEKLGRGEPHYLKDHFVSCPLVIGNDSSLLTK